MWEELFLGQGRGNLNTCGQTCGFLACFSPCFSHFPVLLVGVQVTCKLVLFVPASFPGGQAISAHLGQENIFFVERCQIRGFDWNVRGWLVSRVFEDHRVIEGFCASAAWFWGVSGNCQGVEGFRGPWWVLELAANVGLCIFSSPRVAANLGLFILSSS